jgi:molybdopterin converting factor small subunit
MARVVLQTDVARDFANGRSEIEIAATNVRQLIKRLDGKFPGIGARLGERTAVAIDGEIFQEPLLETIREDSEVYFLPMIEGG